MNLYGVLQQLVATVDQVLHPFVWTVTAAPNQHRLHNDLDERSQRPHEQCYATLLFCNDRSDLRHMFPKILAGHVKTRFL